MSMTDDELARIKARHDAEAKSTAPASKAMVIAAVDGLAAAVAKALKDELGKVRRSADTTESLLQDLDERLERVEALLAAIER